MNELKKILHVDDDADIRTITRMSLEHVGGFEVEQSSSGQEALGIFPKFQPDLLLLDVMMPEMSGQDLWGELRRIPDFGDVPVIFMTAKVEQSFVDELILDGALAVVVKPFDPMELCDQLRKEWQLRTFVG